jgi:serine/threonine protein kinase
MSPELLGAKAQHQAQALYDGTKADIWAAGVMLCVMLIGRFPFEGIEMSNATNLEEVSEHVSATFDLVVLVLGTTTADARKERV